MATREELLGSIRQKYPEYSDIPDAELATSIATKYPDYAQELGENVSVSPSAQIPQSSTAIPQPSDYEDFRKNYIAQQQRPTLQKAIENTFAPVQGLYGIAKDVAGIPAGLGEASGTETPVGTTLNSLLEGARRAGTGFVNLGSQALNEAVMGLIRNPLSPSSGMIQNKITNTLSRTPSEQEIEQAFQEQNLQQSLNRPENQFQPMQGGISENLAQGTAAALPLAIPLVGAEERAAAGGLAMRPVTGLANTIERTFQRGIIKQPLEDVVTYTTGIPAIEGGVEKAQTAVSRILEKTGKLPTREVDAAKTLLERAGPTQEALLNDAKTNLKAFDESGGTINELDGVQQARDLVRSRFSLAVGGEDDAALNAVFEKPEFRNLGDETTSSEVQNHLQELNTQFQRQVDKQSPEALAYRTVRDFLSDKVDDVVKLESGKDISPYRDWGTVADFRQGLESRISGAQKAQSGGRIPTGGLPYTQRGLIAKGVKAAGGRAFVSREIEGINQGALRLVKDLKKTPAPRSLTDNELSAIRARINPPPVISEATSAPVVSPLQNAIEAQAQNLIRMSAGQISPEEALNIARSQVIPPQ